MCIGRESESCQTLQMQDRTEKMMFTCSRVAEKHSHTVYHQKRQEGSTFKEARLLAALCCHSSLLLLVHLHTIDDIMSICIRVDTCCSASMQCLQHV